jgi:hypothetical protein
MSSTFAADLPIAVESIGEHLIHAKTAPSMHRTTRHWRRLNFAGITISRGQVEGLFKKTQSSAATQRFKPRCNALVLESKHVSSKAPGKGSGIGHILAVLFKHEEVAGFRWKERRNFEKDPPSFCKKRKDEFSQ